eukprot:gene17761-23361_t
MMHDGEREEEDEFDQISSTTNLINNSPLISKVAGSATQQLLGNGNNNSKNPNDMPFCGCLSISYYQPFFDVDTSDIVKRLSLAVFYCRRETNFIDIISEKPDAYGPFWISTTLVFTLAVTSHMRGWLSSWMSGTTWVYDFQSIISASSLIYGFASFVPFLVWIILKQYDGNVKLITMICVYGYSLFMFIPASLLCLFPSEVVSWLILLVTAGLSSLFILRSLGPLIIASVKQDSIMLLGPLG